MKKILSVIFTFCLLITSINSNVVLSADTLESNGSWKTDNGKIGVIIQDETRYYDLSSTLSNGNNDGKGADRKAAFYKIEDWYFDKNNGGLSLDFISQVPAKELRFNLEIFHADQSNFFRIGYNKDG